MEFGLVVGKTEIRQRSKSISQQINDLFEVRPDLGIHGTIAPSSGQRKFKSSGSRLHNASNESDT